MTDGRWQGEGATATLAMDGAGWIRLLTRMACTTERTLEMVEELRRDHDSLRRTLEELEGQVHFEPGPRVATESPAVPVVPGEFDQHHWHALAREPNGRELILATSAERGLRPALLLVSHGRAHRALLLGPLEESLLVRLLTEREKAALHGGPAEPLPAKILAARLVSLSPWGDRLRTRPAPGTVRSAFTRLRKKIQLFAGTSALLVGGREGYRLTTPCPENAGSHRQG